MQKIVLFLTFCYFQSAKSQWIVTNTTVTNYTYYPAYPNNYPVPNYPVKNPPYYPPNNVVYSPNQLYYPPRYNDIWKNSQNSTYGWKPRMPDSRYNASHNLIVGAAGPRDILLYKESFQKDGRWYKSREKIITYPDPKKYMEPFKRNRTITAVYCWDKFVNGQGGYATILSGGVGHPNVQIKLNSTGTGKGFLFTVEIYGR